MTTKKKKAQAASSNSNVAKNLQRIDSWYSTTTGAGTSYDKRATISFRQSCALSDSELEALYSENDIAATIVDRVVDDALRQGVVLSWEGSDPETATSFWQWANDKFKLAETTRQARVLSRVFGGGAVMVGYDGSQQMSEPLAGERNQVLFLRAVDKRELWAMEYYIDPASPRYLEPAVYQYATRYGQALQVHESRIVPFHGLITTANQMIDNRGWGYSVLRRVYDTLREFGMSWSSVMYLLQEAAHGIYKMKDLMQLLASDNTDLLLARLAEIDRSKSVFRPILLDADGEDYSRVATPLTDVAPLLQLAMSRVSSAAGMPSTILFGDSPSGLNATGDSEMRSWYDQVKKEQTAILGPAFVKLLAALAQHPESPVRGKALEDLAVEWPSLWQMEPAEEADLYLKVAQADAVYINSGVYLPEEIAIARSGSEVFWGPVQIDTENRQAQLDADVSASYEPEQIDQDQESVATSGDNGNGNTTSAASQN